MGGFRSARFAARAVDFEFRDRLFALGRPPQNVLAATLGMPEDLVSLCFSVQIELTGGESRISAGGQAPTRLGGRLNVRVVRQFSP